MANVYCTSLLLIRVSAAVTLIKAKPPARASKVIPELTPSTALDCGSEISYMKELVGEVCPGLVTFATTI